MVTMSTCLWFDSQAEEAAKFYVSVFKNSKIGKITHYGKAGFDIHQQPEGKVMTVEFEIHGAKFMALNGGPMFKFNEAISVVVECDIQDEIDLYWEKLSEGGDKNAQVCGWLKDKYGLSWQIVPKVLSKLTDDSDRAKSDKVMNAMMKMKKLDINALQQAAR